MEAQFSLNFWELLGLAVLGYLTYLAWDLYQTQRGTVKFKEREESFGKSFSVLSYYFSLNLWVVVASVLIMVGVCYLLLFEDLRPWIIDTLSVGLLNGSNPVMTKPFAYFVLGLFNSVLWINLRKVFKARQIIVKEEPTPPPEPNTEQ